MAEIKKFENIILNITIEDPMNGRIQNYQVQGVRYVEHTKEFIQIEGLANQKYKVNLTFNKEQGQS